MRRPRPHPVLLLVTALVGCDAVTTGPTDLDPAALEDAATPGRQDTHLPPPAATIVFASNVSGNWDIWRIDADGRNLMQLTDDPCQEDSPHWAPGGLAIAYTNWCDGVHIIHPDGSGDWLVPNTDPRSGPFGPDLVMDWGPCRSLLISTEEPVDGKGGIYRIDGDGSNRLRLTDGEDGDHPDAAWGPDCTRFAFDDAVPFRGGSSRVSISPVDVFSPVSLFPSADSHPAEWTRDGHWVVFTSRGDLWRVRPDGTDATELLSCACQGPEASVMPDGHGLVFSQGGGELYLSDLAGAPPRALTSGMGWARQPDVRK